MFPPAAIRCARALCGVVLAACGSASNGPVDAPVDDASPTVDQLIDCTQGTCRYVTPNARGRGDGTDWANAHAGMPASPERGAVYWFADGAYGSLTLDAAEDGPRAITLAKARPADHGSDVGWDPADGDGQAEFQDLMMISDHWVVDGRGRDERDWQRSDSYGIRVTGGVVAHTINVGRATTDATFRYLDVGGPRGETFNPSLPREAFYLGGFDRSVVGWTISRCHLHNVYLPVQMANATDVVVEASWLGPNWSKETIRGQGRAARITIRNNVFKDGCQGTPGDPTAPGCTGQIAMWDGDTNGDFDGSKIYGNVIWTTRPTSHSDACILVGGDNGISAKGVSANAVAIHHNTLVGIAAGRCSLRTPGNGVANHIANNLWAELGPGVTADCEATTCESNMKAGSAQFVAADNGNFHLAVPTQTGTTLAAPYDRDPDGRIRGADGVWDIGAYEY